MLNRIRIVLINTSHPGNIGAAARAMKTMGLSRLYLVNPKHFPDHRADEMASGAHDLLTQARVCASLDEALEDCHLVIGTSARMRTIPWPVVTPREMATKVSEESSDSEVAILFGCEQSGLSNEELQRCHLHVRIPTDATFSSLNLASAVQIIAYELQMATFNQQTFGDAWDCRLATAEEMERMFAHMQDVLTDIDFLKQSAPRRLMTRLRRLFYRARPDTMEVNILRGMLTSVAELQKKEG